MAPGTAIVALWVPAVVFAHVFAVFWFIRTWLIYDPRWLAGLRRRSSSSGGGATTRALPSSHATAAAAAPVGAHACSEGKSDQDDIVLKLGVEMALARKSFCDVAAAGGKLGVWAALALPACAVPSALILPACLHAC
jgi:hypothetical protein